MKGIEDRIVRSIVARSQIVKKCFVNGEQCDFHVEESSYLRDGEYNKYMLDFNEFSGKTNEKFHFSFEK